MTSKRHLVVKRGHKGRYRFVMIDEGERIGGEIHLDRGEVGRDQLHALALGRIAALAERLLQDVAGRAPPSVVLNDLNNVRHSGRERRSEGGLHG